MGTELVTRVLYRSGSRHRSSALREIKPTFDFELRAHEWRNAVDLHHLPEGTHSLAPRPGSLDRWTFQIGPRGRTCTCNLSGLSGTPLHWTTRGWCPRPELHRHCARFKCAVSALDYVGKMVPREGFPPPTSPF